MIEIQTNQIPLDFDISLNDFFMQFMQHNRQIRNDKISYNYQDILSIKEPIGITLLPETLIYYPKLCRQIRKLNKLDYGVNLHLEKIESIFQKGLSSIIESLNLIQDRLHHVLCEKSKLDAQVNNLIYLYGQHKTLPVLRSIKPYFYNRLNGYPSKLTTSYIINIAGINYYLNYQGKRFGTLKCIFPITTRQILTHYFETNKRNAHAISPCAIITFIGGIINTPIFIFRVKQRQQHRGKKYFINLDNCQTYTRLADAKEAEQKYTNYFDLKIIKD